MTQVFDQETGRLTPVTVIEAGPAPWSRSGRPNGRLRRRPARLRRGGRAQAHEAEARASEEARRRPAPQARGDPRARHELAPGETVTVEAFEPGEKVKVSGVSIGKGFQGTIKRHRFHRGPVSHGSHNVRAPGLDRRLGDAVARLQGHEDARPDGRRRTSPRSASQSSTATPEQNLLLVKGAVPGHKNGVVVVREDKR